jgi:hypothetical protein
LIQEILSNLKTIANKNHQVGKIPSDGYLILIPEGFAPMPEKLFNLKSIGLKSQLRTTKRI